MDKDTAEGETGAHQGGRKRGGHPTGQKEEIGDSKRKMMRPVKENGGQSKTLRIRRTQTPKSFQGSCPSLFQPARTLFPLLPFSRHLGHFHLKVCVLPVTLLSHVCTSMVKFLKDSVAYISICALKAHSVCVCAQLLPYNCFSLCLT